jgi:hypothetical protein
MKKIFPFLIICTVFFACNNNPKSDLNSNKVMLIDTSKMYNSNVLTDTGSVIHATALPKNNNQNLQPAGNNYSGTPAPVHRNTARYNSNNVSTATTSSSTTATSAPVRRRRGWSHAAKDATIGGVGGAVAGAVIDKKHGQGAIIGGVVGAAGGYILGRSKDKKEGR